MNRLLVALDATPRADYVLDHAIALATTLGGKLFLLRVVPDSVEPPAPSIWEPAGDVNALVAAAEAELWSAEERVPAELRGGVRAEVGKPWEVICARARALEADLIVIGAHRYGLVDRVLGTTAARVVNRSDRAVLVVRPARAAPALAEVAAKLRDEHVKLTRGYDELLAAYGCGDWGAVDAAWAPIEASLRAHIALEEAEVLPLLDERAPAEAAALRADHAELLANLDAIVVGLELHTLPLARAEEIVGRLRAHAEREERVLERSFVRPATRAVAKPAA